MYDATANPRSLTGPDIFDDLEHDDFDPGSAEDELRIYSAIQETLSTKGWEYIHSFLVFKKDEAQRLLINGLDSARDEDKLRGRISSIDALINYETIVTQEIERLQEALENHGSS